MPEYELIVAELNDDNVCISLTGYRTPMSTPIEGNKLILEVYDDSVVGQEWDGSNWNELPPPPEPD